MGSGRDGAGPAAGRRVLSRRRVLLGAAAVGGVAAGTAVERVVTRPHRRAGPSTAAPRSLVVRDHVVLDHDVTVDSIEVTESGVLEFAADRSVTVRSHGNVTVHGTLRMQPVDADRTHRVIFPSVDESRYAGGMMVVPGDIGLWVLGSGRLDLQGARRTAWVRAAGAVAAGTLTIELAQAPAGWRTGDELVVVPTGSPDRAAHYDAYDTVIVDEVEHSTVHLRTAVARDHPAVTVGRGLTLGAEVLNLTRNVTIEATPQGRAHVFILSGVAQHVGQVGIRNMGPRHGAAGVLSRYPLHFHTCGDGSRGSTVSDVVVRDCGNHAFVAHASNGVTFRGCISHNTLGDAYWWDQAPDTRTPGPPTDDVTYLGCVASRVRPGDPRDYRLTGFNLSRGSGDVARDCVAVGVQGPKNSSGFEWPESGTGLWRFSDNVAHNNMVDGIFTWQNNNLAHVIERFVGYHNGQAGIEHGAYNNAYRYTDALLYGNGQAGVVLHAVSAADRQQVFDGLLIDGAGRTPYAVQVVKHTLPSDNPSVFARCDLRGYTDAGFGFTYSGGDGGTQPEHVDIVGCAFSGEPVWLSDSVAAGSTVRVQPLSGPARQFGPADGPGQLDPRANARVSAIAPFAAVPRTNLPAITVAAAAPAPSGR